MQTQCLWQSAAGSDQRSNALLHKDMSAKPEVRPSAPESVRIPPTDLDGLLRLPRYASGIVSRGASEAWERCYSTS
jgi:hypothetical protein